MGMVIPFWKQVLSWIYPVTLDKRSSAKHPLIFLKKYQGQLILATPDAYYSYGVLYLPYKKMFQVIEKELPRVHTFLMLGTGLGSALKILQEKYHCYPKADLVEWDEEIIDWSASEMNLNTKQNVRWYAEDAAQFVLNTSHRYDLIALDLFRDIETPATFKSQPFYQQCRELLNDHGLLCINLIPSFVGEEKKIIELLRPLFQQIEELVYAKNVFLICRA